jgi:hypothetical protein
MNETPIRAKTREADTRRGEGGLRRSTTFGRRKEMR